jgi:hypothetical protein
LITAGVASLVGCAAPAATPTATAQAIVARGQTNENLLFTATVHDHTDSLAAAEVVPADSTGLNLSNPDTEGVAPVEDEVTALYVGWIGLPCEDRPSLQVRTGEQGLEISLDKGPQREGETCPSYPHYFAVRLDFSGPIDAGDVALNLAE